MIDDARERRNLSINGKSKILECDKCDLKTTSKTTLNKHIKIAHKEHHKQQSQEMRKRFTCDKCDYKTTSKTVLTNHTESKYGNKEISESKRKICSKCGKKFNKMTTFNTHMETCHKEGQEIQFNQCQKPKVN